MWEALDCPSNYIHFLKLLLDSFDPILDSSNSLLDSSLDSSVEIVNLFSQFDGKCGNLNLKFQSENHLEWIGDGYLSTSAPWVSIGVR